MDHVIEEVLKNAPSPEQIFLKKYLSADFSKREAKYIWKRIVEHKWHISERLRRDVGFRVAAAIISKTFTSPSFSELPGETRVLRIRCWNFSELFRAPNTSDRNRSKENELLIFGIIFFIHTERFL
jgi:hypothetical protein